MIEGGRPQAGLLVLLGATLACGLLASAFALVNERNGVSIPGGVEKHSTDEIGVVARRPSVARFHSDMSDAMPAPPNSAR